MAIVHVSHCSLWNLGDIIPKYWNMIVGLDGRHLCNMWTYNAGNVVLAGGKKCRKHPRIKIKHRNCAIFMFLFKFYAILCFVQILCHFMHFSNFMPLYVFVQILWHTFAQNLCHFMILLKIYAFLCNQPLIEYMTLSYILCFTLSSSFVFVFHLTQSCNDFKA